MYDVAPVTGAHETVTFMLPHKAVTLAGVAGTVELAPADVVLPPPPPHAATSTAVTNIINQDATAYLRLLILNLPYAMVN